MNIFVLLLIVSAKWLGLARNLPEYEISALNDLYVSTDGYNWLWDLNEPVSTQWNFDSEDVNPCLYNWQGITCLNSSINSNLANVVSLHLTYFRLVGTLPPSIGNFSEMYNLNLNSNKLSGSIPAEIGNLGAILDLNLNNNTLSHSIPESLYDLVGLSYLDLSYNHLNGSLSSKIGNLYQLTDLMLMFNRLTGIFPAELNNCTQIYTLHASDNFFYGSLPSLGALSLLQSLDLGDNGFSGSLPPDFADFCIGNNVFTSLILESNHLTGTLLESFNLCTSIEEFYLEDNRFNGTIPDFTWDTIQYLYLDFNNLTGPIPLHLSDNMLQFDVDFNSLNGTLPVYLFNGTLEIISAAHNLLTGSLAFTANHHLETLMLAFNQFTGTLPENLFAEALDTIDLSNNLFHGTLPSVYNADMTYMVLNNNQFDGTLPTSLTLLQYLIFVNFASNQLEGPFLPFSVSGLEALQFDDNLLTGTIPEEVLSSNQLLFLNLGDNLMTGTIPSQSIQKMVALTNFNLYNNLFSGPLPAPISTLSSVQSIFLDGNMLTGDLGVMFDGSVQKVLKYVDVSNNQLHGTIPTSPFQVTSLLSFAAVSNCLYGSLPSAEICALNNLTTLAMDGLESASSCQQVFISHAPYIYKAYGIENKVNGPVAPCLFNMTNLKTLHLSGNAITGSIASDVMIGEALQDLSLSHNSITGTIPESIQLRSWTNLDLSYNKLTGGLSHAFPELADDSSLSLEVNRLSGVIPHSLKHAKSVDILDGNLWKCNTDRSQLPDNDKNSDVYECGSNTFNYSVYIWIVLAFIAACIIGCAWLFQNGEGKSQGWLQGLKKDFDSWMAVFSRDDNKQLMDCNRTSLVELGEFARGVRESNGWITLFIVAFLMPAYIALSFTENTYAYEYAWTVSAAYLSGPVSTAVLMTGFALLALLTVGAVYKYVNRNRHMMGVSAKSIVRNYSCELVMSFIAVVLLNIGSVTVVNILYVYVHVTYDSTTVHLAQVALAVFKLVWNNWAVRELLKLTKRFERGGNTRVGVEVFMILFNNLGAPFIATAFVSTNCFYNVVAAPPKVNVSYTYVACIASDYYTNGSICLYYNPAELVSTSYEPPFLYSYQCASTFITTYATIYVFMFIMAAFASPVAFALLLLTYKKTVPSTTLHTLVDLVTPRILKPAAVSKVEHNFIEKSSFEDANPRLEKLMNGYEREDEKEYVSVFHCDLFVVKVINILAMILTFGTALPPVAIVGFAAVVSFTYYTQLLIGRYVVRAHGNTDKIKIIESVNRDCELASDMFMNAVWIVAPFTIAFYAMLLLDTLGDGEGWRRALWAPLVTIFVPMALWLLATFLQSSRSARGNGQEKKDSFFADHETKNSLTENPIGVNVGIVGKL